MESDEFRNAITNGLGRAILWLKNHPWRPHCEAIEDVCLHNSAYDPQCEDGRAEYAYEAICLTNEREHFVKLVMAELPQARSYWNVNHLFRVGFLLSNDTDVDVRRAIYDKFERDDAEEHFVGASEIIEFDRANGLLFVLDRIGRYIEANPDYWIDSSLLEDAERVIGFRFSELVREAAPANGNIQRYIDAAEAHRRVTCQSHSADDLPLSYHDLRHRIISARGEVHRGRLYRWGKLASEKMLQEAAADLLKETDNQALIAYVRLFDRRPFPLDPGRLVELARSDRGDLAAAALRALRHIQDRTVRALALNLISDGRADDDAVRLWIKNFEVGDEQMLESLLDRHSGEDAFHRIAHAVVEVFKANRNATAGPSMLRVFETCRCSLCRMGAVEVLIEREVAPPWLLQECRYDSNPNIRRMVTG